ncbi:MAG: hypothetical protein FWC26_09035 [Fibromonadales bacterium]|nr:hypothetical protein [Fibromonadales bacterium]
MTKHTLSLILALLALFGCTTSKPVDIQAVKTDDAKCSDLFNLGMVKADPESIKYLKASTDMCEYGNSVIPCGIEGYETNIKCVCVESITRNNEEYCINHKCPSYKGLVPLFY